MRLVDANPIKKEIKHIAMLSNPKDSKPVIAAKKKLADQIIDVIDTAEIITFEKVLLPKMNEANLWNNVADVCPPRNCNVLCYFIYNDGAGAMAENRYYGNGQWLSEGKYVAFWRELPELPPGIIDD